MMRFKSIIACIAWTLVISAGRAVAANPEGDNLAGQGSTAAAKGDYTSAIGFFQRAIQADPNEVGYVASLATTYAQAGKFQEGEQTLESRMASFPGSEVVVLIGDYFQTPADAIVSPANSFGIMDGGLDLAIRNQLGSVVEEKIQDVSVQKHCAGFRAHSELKALDWPQLP